MAIFEVVGNIDPLLKVQLDEGENIIAESNAMVSMDATLELTGKASGGLMESLKRKVLQGESLFQQHIVASGGAGQVTLAPVTTGDIRVLEVGNQQYCLSDGAFLASSSELIIKVKTQGIGKSLFGGTGGFFIMETSGHGTLAVSGFGSIHIVEPQPGQELIIDNGHVLAWDSSLEYEVSMSINKSSSFFGKLLNSHISGEGLILRFKGEGKILICSRNRGSFLSWIFANSPAKGNANAAL